MKMIDTNGRPEIEGGTFKVWGNLRMQTPGNYVSWPDQDTVLWSPDWETFAITSLSGVGSVLEIRETSNPPALPGGSSAAIFSMNVSSFTEMFVMDSAGNMSQLSSHAQDAPVWMYDSDDPLPRVFFEANLFLGIVRYTNESRRAKLFHDMLSGVDLTGLPPEKRTFIHVETFAEHNQRTNLPVEKQFKVLDWAEEQNALQATFDAARLVAIERGETPSPAQDIRKPIPQWLAERIASPLPT